jgi:hypothetical protein
LLHNAVGERPNGLRGPLLDQVDVLRLPELAADLGLLQRGQPLVQEDRPILEPREPLVRDDLAEQGGQDGTEHGNG